MNCIGIEIGGTKLQVVLGDGVSGIQRRVRLDVQPGKGAEEIQCQIESVLDQLVPEGSARAIGVGFGGPVDRITGRVHTSHQVSGWSGFGLVEWLEKRYGIPVALENDANVAALAEALFGVGKDKEIVFYITLGSGVGGGLVMHKKLYHGAVPGEVEVGHLRLDRNGTSLESCCSGWAVDKRIRDAIQQERSGVLFDLAHGALSGEARYLAPALALGDDTAKRILHDIADTLAFGLSHVVHLFHPDIVVIGGGLSLIGAPLAVATAAELPKHLMQAFVPGPTVALAQCGEDVVPLGALALARHRVSI